MIFLVLKYVVQELKYNLVLGPALLGAAVSLWLAVDEVVKCEEYGFICMLVGYALALCMGGYAIKLIFL